MGLSASQVRLLSLTQRQHAVEYEAQKIQAQKLQLANESDKAYMEYMDKLDATKIQYKIIADDGGITFDNATFSKLAQSEFLFNVDGIICEKLGTTSDAAGSNSVIGALKAKGIEISPTADNYTLLSSLVSEGLVVIMEKRSDMESGYMYYLDETDGKGRLKYQSVADVAPTVYTIDDLQTGQANYDNARKFLDKIFVNTSISSSTNIQEVSDEVNLKKAEAEYEGAMNRINTKDSRYDTQLSQLEAERQAIKTEMDSLKNVAKENVDRTFKLFG